LALYLFTHKNIFGSDLKKWQSIAIFFALKIVPILIKKERNGNWTEMLGNS